MKVLKSFCSEVLFSNLLGWSVPITLKLLTSARTSCSVPCPVTLELFWRAWWFSPMVWAHLVLEQGGALGQSCCWLLLGFLPSILWPLFPLKGTSLLLLSYQDSGDWSPTLFHWSETLINTPPHLAKSNSALLHFQVAKFKTWREI